MPDHRHYEILVLTRGTWKLHQATSDRNAAIDDARRLSEVGDYAAVRVIECRLDDRTGRFEETPVRRFERRTTADRRSAGPGGLSQSGGGGVGAKASVIVCGEPDDFYGPVATGLIGDALRGYFDSRVLTAIELLHCQSHVDALFEAGTVLQAAVQHAAMAHPGARLVGAPALVKQIFAVMDAARERLSADTARLPQVEGGFADLRAAVDRDLRRMRMLVAERLYHAGTWAEKIEAVMALMAPRSPSAEDVAELDVWFAEACRCRGMLVTLLEARHQPAAAFADRLAVGGGPPGEAEDPAGSGRRPQVALVAALFDLLGVGRGAASRDDGDLAPELERSLRLLASGCLPRAATVILERIAREVASRRPFAEVEGTEPQREAKAIAEVATLLDEAAALPAAAEPGHAAAAAGQPPPLVAAIDQIRLALDERSERLLRPEMLGRRLAELTDPVEAIDYLVELVRDLSGEMNRRRIGMHLVARLGAEFEQRRLIEVDGNQARVHVKLIARWQAEIEGIAFPADIAGRLCDTLDHLCTGLIERARLFEAVARQRPDPIDQVIALFDLVHSRVITRGAASQRARRRALDCVRAAGGVQTFVTALGQRGLSKRRLRALRRFLAPTEAVVQAAREREPAALAP